eukprot:GHVR01046225.1.p1 GENE.GHVR01046225.1~~GHVR01046225.1.p1  ORF type:complete len:108 (+),score=19.83 GHVR01046225.1:190-513(+)
MINRESKSVNKNICDIESLFVRHKELTRRVIEGCSTQFYNTDYTYRNDNNDFIARKKKSVSIERAGNLVFTGGQNVGRSDRRKSDRTKHIIENGNVLCRHTHTYRFR